MSLDELADRIADRLIHRLSTGHGQWPENVDNFLERLRVQRHQAASSDSADFARSVDSAGAPQAALDRRESPDRETDEQHGIPEHLLMAGYGVHVVTIGPGDAHTFDSDGRELGCTCR